jgi:hypothetical protein
MYLARLLPLGLATYVSTQALTAILADNNATLSTLSGAYTPRVCCSNMQPADSMVRPSSARSRCRSDAINRPEYHHPSPVRYCLREFVGKKPEVGRVDGEPQGTHRGTAISCLDGQVTVERLFNNAKIPCDSTYDAVRQRHRRPESRARFGEWHGEGVLRI